MRTHIDWITFTMAPRYGTYDANGMSAGDDYAKAIEQAWITTFDPETLGRVFGGNWVKQEKSRAPYTDAWQLPNRGITLFAGIALNHCCVEISGGGCETLISTGLLGIVLNAVADRVTRVDIACDIETTVTPEEFVSDRSHKRFTADGYQNSKSGQTRYVGSKKSERFARVYRYAKPHPRSHLLRIEHVFHKESAKAVAREIMVHSVDAVSRASGEIFGWNHPIWEPDIQSLADLSCTGVERNAGKTVFWLCNSVAPAFKRLCRDGIINDPEAFIRRYFLGDHNDA